MNFEDVIDGIVEREKGYVDHPNDRGGPTNYGITVAVARKNGYHGRHEGDAARAGARDLPARYIAEPKFDLVWLCDESIGDELIDTGVNMGPSRAARDAAALAQRLQQARLAVRRRLRRRRLGDVSLDALRVPSRRGSEGSRVMVCALNCTQGARYLESRRGRRPTGRLSLWVDPQPRAARGNVMIIKEVAVAIAVAIALAGCASLNDAGHVGYTAASTPKGCELASLTARNSSRAPSRSTAVRPVRRGRGRVQGLQGRGDRREGCGRLPVTDLANILSRRWCGQVSAFLTDLDTRLVCEFDNTEPPAGGWSTTPTCSSASWWCPQDFITDFASVPRLLGSYLLFGGKGRRASALHDMLYTSRIVDRETADQVLREAMLATGYAASRPGLLPGRARRRPAHWDKDSVPQPLHVDAAIEADALMLRAGG
jgi:hypothetical protein